MKTSAETILHHAIKCLERWEKHHQSLDDILDSPNLVELKIRNTVSDLLFNYFRHKGLVDAIIENFTKELKPELRRLLVLCLTQTMYQTGINKFSAINIAVDYAKKNFGKKRGGFINAVLRNSQRLDLKSFISASPRWIQLNLPQLVYSRWQNYFSEDVIEKICDEIREKAALTFRTLTSIDETELEQLASRKIQNSDWNKSFDLFVTDNPQKLLESSSLDQGKIYIQDPSTLLAPSMPETIPQRILDTCAAPGGKSLALAQRFPQAMLVANDRSFNRQKRTFANLAKHHSEFHFATVSNGTLLPFHHSVFDLILLDVPCSNTGVLRHRPDAIWRFSQKQIRELVTIQKELLQHAVPLLKPGGCIVYSTCSIEPEENSHQIKSFLTANPDFKLLKEQQLFPEKYSDGAYAALLQKK